MSRSTPIRRARPSRTSRTLPLTLASVVTDYVRREREPAIERLLFYLNQPPERILDLVASWRGPDGACEPRQRRVPRAARERAGAAIRALRLEGLASFEELHDRVAESIGRIRGIGALTVYDVSFRIGAFLGVMPRRVYLHGGALAGARALDAAFQAGPRRPEAFPRWFRALEPWEIENCLCVYKEALRAIGRRKRAA
jgi:hypothetical protein